jgi:hypothetical protein
MRKIWRLQGISESYQIARRFDVPASERSEVNPRLASLCIDRWLADPFAQQTMVEMYESVSGRAGSVATRLRGPDIHRYIKPELLEAFRRGDLLFKREAHLGIIPTAREKPVTPPDSDEPSAPPPSAPIAKKTWVEIELVDEQDNPVPNERFRLEWPDGTTRTGTLGENGKARITGIDPGACKVSFPDFDASEWKAA